MTRLSHLIAARIASEGPMSIAEYMATCLLHPDHGYYTTRTALGHAGDFTTAPEISQMFGELIGAWIAEIWTGQGAPAPFVLAELGPGRGTLMADLLRVISRLPGMRDAARVHLVEASPAMRDRQAATLTGIPVTWHDTISTLPDSPLFLIANEFFDALPVRQFVRQGPGWSERMIGLAQGELMFGLSPAAPVAALVHRLSDTGDGDIVELCPASPAITSEIARRIARFGGAALVIDYGDGPSRGDTFQALRNHLPADPLTDPGMADLTAHVDFHALARAFRDGGAAVTAMIPQGVFLERLGITARARTLAGSLSGAALDSHIAAHRRLTHADEMGRLFKVIACHPPSSPTPPGLDPA
jgi:NADH dehydrogenase [ubiquinone] 1 alpha subcomplex assembly factor 7